MKLAVSNIGWSAASDAAILPRLRDAGAEAIEVAPGRLFADPPNATRAEAESVSATYREQQLPIVSMQSLLFGRPNLKLFGNAAELRALLDHLSQVIGLAGTLGCGPLVFGSPKNRLRGERSFEQACEAAVPVFAEIGEIAAEADAVFCLEANARDYGCDFMTVLAEAGSVVAGVRHPAVCQVIDTGNMMMEGESPTAVRQVFEHIRHVHISAPQLGPVAEHRGFVGKVVSLLAEQGYDGILTVEMRPGETRSGETRSGTHADDPDSPLLHAVAMLRELIDRA